MSPRHLAPEAREAHVRKRAEGDEELIAQVLNMLEASKEAETFLDSTNRSDLDEAEPYFQDSYDIHVRLLGPRHVIVAIDHTILAGLDKRRERPSSAINHYLAALDIFQEALPVGNRRIVSAARSVGDLLEGEGRLAEAERYLDLVVDAFDASSPQNATQVGDLINLARVQMQNGRRQAAETWLAANPNEELSAAIATLRG